MLGERRVCVHAQTSKRQVVFEGGGVCESESQESVLWCRQGGQSWGITNIFIMAQTAQGLGNKFCQQGSTAKPQMRAPHFSSVNHVTDFTIMADPQQQQGLAGQVFGDQM